MNLKKLRNSIDSIDKKILRLLNSRAGLAKSIAAVKQKTGRSAYSPDRETEVLRKISQMNKGPLTAGALESIYKEIMSYSLSVARPLNIAYLGPKASFSNLAAMKRFGSQVDYLACESIDDVFKEVERGNADYGVVPIENSIEGAVTYTLDTFVDSDLKICSQLMLDITHCLLVKNLSVKIERIYSNPQVFGQCKGWLQKNLPGADKIEVSSTTRAAQIAAKEKNCACIASSLAAKVYGLKVVACGIEDSLHNVTRFLVIGNSDVAPTRSDKTSILFSIKDRVGALHDMLVPFKKYKINLTKIESRPSKKRAWDYYFFIDMEGHRNEPKVKRALAELEGKCKFLKILGSYPNNG